MELCTLVEARCVEVSPRGPGHLRERVLSHSLSAHRGTEPELEVACSLYVCNVSTCKQF